MMVGRYDFNREDKIIIRDDIKVEIPQKIKKKQVSLGMCWEKQYRRGNGIC